MQNPPAFDARNHTLLRIYHSQGLQGFGLQPETLAGRLLAIQIREGKGYIAAPACRGSLAEATSLQPNQSKLKSKMS
eukprot:1068339-Pelagomonas_calceolata.AAC.4